MTWDSSLETRFYGQILCNAQGQQPSYHYSYVLTLIFLKRQTKLAAGDILIFYFYLLKKIRLDVSSESSA